MNQYVKQNQKTTVKTASNEKIMIIINEYAIKFLNNAKITHKENKSL